MTATDERAFAALVDAHRAELHAHCYRLLGSVHDADDALQETLLRAWRGIAGLHDDSSARSWLYAIATNVCLTELRRRGKRMLPHDFGPPVDGNTPPGAPITESVWLDPYPDQSLGLPDGKVSPEARYELRESVELAFVAALQHLAANQRAVLILREVLGFSAAETAAVLATTVASVNSSLQRARATVAARMPARSQQTAVRALGDQGLAELVGRYIDAWERNDVDAFTTLLVEDASFAMPPLRTWYTPRREIDSWARGSSMSGAWRWKALPTTANGQPALAFYAWDEPQRAYLPFALNVLTLRDGRICDVTAFIVRATNAPDDGSYQRFPEQPVDVGRHALSFANFNLPALIR